MIQFNLLPDVKIEYIKTRNRKRLIMLICTIASAVSIGLFLILFLFVKVNQPKHINDLGKDIKRDVSKIQSTPDLDKILTIQNQLSSLPDLHDRKVVSSRLSDYLTKLTPNDVTLSDVVVDFEANTMIIKGNANNLATVNKYADTLKFTDYKVNGEGSASGKAFKDVVLQSFTVTSGQTNAVTYDIALAFDPLIFSQVKEIEANSPEQVTLNIPTITSTRSQTEKPSRLFAPQPQQQQEGDR